VLGEFLASGRFASVRAIQRSPVPNVDLAAKVIERANQSNEAALLTVCGRHPHVVDFFGCIQVNPLWHILLLERCHGGELFAYIASMEHGLDEHRCARWMNELLSAIEHCHALGIVHRDIKPENLLLHTASLDAPLKVADFGAAKQIGNMQPGSHTPCGSRGYAAPEMTTLYGPAADLWSCGVVAYVLLTGRMPTFTTAAEPRREASMHVELDTPANLFEAISDRALQFVRSLLRPQAVRPTAAQARTHPWLVMQRAELEPKEVAKLEEPVACLGSTPTSQTGCPPGGAMHTPPVLDASPQHGLLTPRRLRESVPLPPLPFLNDEWMLVAKADANPAISLPPLMLAPPAHGMSAALPDQMSATPSTRSLSVSSGLDMLGSSQQRKRSSHEGVCLSLLALPHVERTPRTLSLLKGSDCQAVKPRCAHAAGARGCASDGASTSESSGECSPSASIMASPLTASPSFKGAINSPSKCESKEGSSARAAVGEDSPAAKWSSRAREPVGAAADESQPNLKRARSISSFLKDLQFREVE